jgi:hypothetical protein
MVDWVEVTDGQIMAGIYKSIITNGPRISLTELDKFDANQQFLMDIAMWYGFLEKASDQVRKQWKHDTIRRVFTLLLKGGLMVKRSNAHPPWVTWRTKGGPVASVISHTARVVVQLPQGQAKEREFWTWLWNGNNAQARAAATHGVEAIRSVPLIPGLRKLVKENKSGGSCDHYGINIALGGEGNTNPVSGNRIYPNGEHGHLYLALSKQRYSQRKILLIATEQSAPVDRYSGKGTGGVKGGFFSKVGSFLSSGGVPDQYGGAHGLGGHSDRAANGGQDWTEGYLKTGQTNRLTAYGPGPAKACYLDGMLIDLTAARFDALKNFAFTKDMLGLTPEAPA